MEKKISCPVCGKYDFREECDYEICPYCGWENGNSDTIYHPNGDLTIADYRLQITDYGTKCISIQIQIIFGRNTLFRI